MRRGTSSKPVILGTLGLITGLPNALISLFSATIIEIHADSTANSDTDYALFYMSMIGIASIIGFVASLVGKRLYLIAGLTMLVCGFLLLISMVTANLFLVFPAAFFSIGGIVCFTQKKVKMKLRI